MGRYVMRCPECAKQNQDVYLEVRGGLFNKGFFGDRKKACPNGHIIWVKYERTAQKVCPHCGNTVVYDQSKGEEVKCVVCHKPLNRAEDNSLSVQLSCPQCSCIHTVRKDKDFTECAVCGYNIDIQRELSKQKMKKENVVSLIKYEGDNNTLVWKFPFEDFKMGSQLVVHESQEALLFSGGQALDLFTQGRTYTLNAGSVPLLSAFYKLPSGEDTFHTEVYFINKTVQTGIRWGISNNNLNIKDPYSGYVFPLGANGVMSIQVENSKKLILKLVGTTNVLAHSGSLDSGNSAHTNRNGSSDAVLKHIKAQILRCARPIIVQEIENRQISLITIDNHAELISELVQKRLNEELEEYGLSVPDFVITSFLTPDKTDSSPIDRERFEQVKALVSAHIEIKDIENQTRIEIAKANLDNAQGQRILIQQDYENESLRRRAKAEADAYVADAGAQAEGQRLMYESGISALREGGASVTDVMAHRERMQTAESLGQMGANSSGGGIVGEFAGLAMAAGIGGNIMREARDMGNIGYKPQTENAPGTGIGFSAAAPVPPPLPVSVYHVAINGQPAGPFDISTLKQMAVSGQLERSSLVWKAGMAAWAKAETVDELQEVLANIMPPLPPV